MWVSLVSGRWFAGDKWHTRRQQRGFGGCQGKRRGKGFIAGREKGGARFGGRLSGQLRGGGQGRRFHVNGCRGGDDDLGGSCFANDTCWGFGAAY